MIILGIDPGLAFTGYGAIKTSNKTLSLLGYGQIKTEKTLVFSERLGFIAKELKKIINKYEPQAAAIEELFFCKNVKTALSVGQAKGAIISMCNFCNLPIHEYTPLEVKQSVAGYGKADKIQVQKMVKIILKLKSIPEPHHAADALAIAICCAHTIQ